MLREAALQFQLQAVLKLEGIRGPVERCLILLPVIVGTIAAGHVMQMNAAGVGEALLFENTSTFQEISEISHMLQGKLMGDVWWDRVQRFRYGPLERLKRIIDRVLGRNLNIFQPHLMTCLHSLISSS